MNTTPTSRSDESGWYEIRLQGRLDSRWSARFDGMTLTTGDGVTVLTGPVIDQSALHALLHQLRDIGIPLASVARLETDDTQHPTRTPDTTSSGA
jgi:hypothetical protein